MYIHVCARPAYMNSAEGFALHHSMYMVRKTTAIGNAHSQSIIMQLFYDVTSARVCHKALQLYTLRLVLLQPRLQLNDLRWR